MHLPDGHLLQNGKYKLFNTIGQGGFGITYKGFWHTEVKGSLGKVKTDVPICIKEYFFKDYCYRNPNSNAVEIHSETGSILFHKFKEKLIKEASILSAVHHPYIVNVLEVFEENNTAYIAMEYIAGFSLRQRMEREVFLPENVVLKYIHQIGKALQFVHGKSILHLDIKPSNILIDELDNARLIDFGVSKRYDMNSQDTSTTMLTLSKGFASIEQYDDEGTLLFSPCPDIYSLGATMYNLLTGKIPTESILRATKELEKPTVFNPEITHKTESVILKAMQIIPADRYPSVAEMLQALDLPPTEVKKKTTPVLTPSNLLDKDSETLLYDPANFNDIKEKSLEQDTISSGRKRSITYIFLFALILLASSAFLFLNNKRIPVIAAIIPETNFKDNEHNKQEPEMDQGLLVENKNEELSDWQGAPISKEVEVTPLEEKMTDKKEESKPVQEEDIQYSEVETDSLLPGENLLLYKELLAAGKDKMEKGDFPGAKSDFEKAREEELTEDIVRLIIAVDSKIEEQLIVEKKKQYEEKMPFGSYMIVRKKETDRYGVIDVKGNEIIACIYLSVGRAENGRSFLREDNLFDIYDENGRRLSEGVANY